MHKFVTHNGSQSCSSVAAIWVPGLLRLWWMGVHPLLQSPFPVDQSNEWGMDCDVEKQFKTHKFSFGLDSIAVPLFTNSH